MTDQDAARIVGPAAWYNWQAQLAGQPARTSTRTHAFIFIPLWQEFGLHSDAWVTGEWADGPFDLDLAFPDYFASGVGMSRLCVVLRARDHLGDPSDERWDQTKVDTAAFTGGDVGNQFAAILSLALSRRFRSAGVMRTGDEEHPYGRPMYMDYVPPFLAPPGRRPMLPGVADTTNLADAAPYLTAYSKLSGVAAVALQRAANQFADALWWADADPRISWIKLFGALEAAADPWDATERPAPIIQLQRRHKGLYDELAKKCPDALPIVARRLSRIIGAETKLIDFTLAHDPGPPIHRPSFHVVDYNHRSNDLHQGLPFPPPLCEPPVLGENGVPNEVFWALAASEQGGSWPVSELPMTLHTFAYLVGGALRRWWLQQVPA